MRHLILGLAALLTMTVMIASAPAEARMTNGALSANGLTDTGVQTVHYRRYRHSHRPSYRSRSRYRHCWNERIRVRTPIGVFVYRTVRRCGWRYRYF
jgi:hypothetical protein